MGRRHEGHKGPQVQRGKGMERTRAPSSPGEGWGGDQDLPRAGRWREKSSVTFWSYLREEPIFITNRDKTSEPLHFSMEILQYFLL